MTLGPSRRNNAIIGAFAPVSDPLVRCVFSRLNPANPDTTLPTVDAGVTVTVAAAIAPETGGLPATAAAQLIVVLGPPARPVETEPDADPAEEPAEASPCPTADAPDRPDAPASIPDDAPAVLPADAPDDRPPDAAPEEDGEPDADPVEEPLATDPPAEPPEEPAPDEEPLDDG